MNKKNFNRMVALICLALIAVPSIGKKWKAEHVFIIGLDGWGAYSVEKADMPNVKQLMNEGCYTLKKRSVLPSSSAVNWASMFMGAGPELHGYTEWGVSSPGTSVKSHRKKQHFPHCFPTFEERGTRS